MLSLELPNGTKIEPIVNLNNEELRRLLQSLGSQNVFMIINHDTCIIYWCIQTPAFKIYTKSYEYTVRLLGLLKNISLPPNVDLFTFMSEIPPMTRRESIQAIINIRSELKLDELITSDRKNIELEKMIAEYERQMYPTQMNTSNDPDEYD